MCSDHTLENETAPMLSALFVINLRMPKRGAVLAETLPQT